MRHLLPFLLIVGLTATAPVLDLLWAATPLYTSTQSTFSPSVRDNPASWRSSYKSSAGWDTPFSNPMVRPKPTPSSSSSGGSGYRSSGGYSYGK